MSDLDRLLAPPPPNGQGEDPLVADLRERQRRAASLHIVRDEGSPDKAGRANELSRRFGVPAESVERNLPQFEAAARQAQASPLLKDYPAIGKWVAEPRHAAVGRDDIPNLARISKAFHDYSAGQEVVRAERAAALRRRFGDVSIPSAPKPNTRNFFGGVWESFVQGGELAKQSGRQAMRDWMGSSGIGNNFRLIERAQGRIDAATPGFESATMRGVYGGASSLARTAPALGLSIALRSPAPVLSVMGTQTGVSAYGKYRARGASPGLSAVGGLGEGAVEVVTELIPMRYAVDAFGKAGFGAFVGGVLARDLPGEQIATITQDAIDTAIANPDKTWAEYRAERPGAAYQTLIATLTQSLAVGGPSALTQRFSRHREATEAEANAGLLEGLVAAASESKVRQRDPESLRRFVEIHAEGTEVENVYIPGEVLRELLQSDSGGFLGNYSKQIAEAAETGGDVVISLAEVAANLAGTPAWDAIKDDVRLSPGGMSVREARSFDEAHADELEAMGRDITARMEQEAAAQAPREKIVEEMRDKLMAAGYRPDVAQAYAEMTAARYATRAARLGQELTGEEAGALLIQSSVEAPGELVPAEAVDGGLIETLTSADFTAEEGGERAFSPAIAKPALARVKTAISKGLHVTLVAEGKPARIVAVSRGMMEDESGQRWGTMLIATDNTGRNRIEIRNPRGLAQSFNEGTRGRITFASDGKSIIDLFEGRDLSTFIHESGHLYIEELKADAEKALELDTPEGRQVFADWEAIKAWFKREGAEVGDTIPTEAHELWARGFERFAMEGRSPSGALRRAFDAFRAWLLTIYKVVENLRSPISPEVRGVMERLLATDQEIAEAAEAQNIKALFATPEEAAEFGMAAPAYAEYRKATEEVREEAYDALLYRTMAAIRKSKTKEWRDEKVAVEAEVTEAVDRQPVFRALKLLADKDQRVKLDRKWLIDTYGPDILDQLPKRVPDIHSDKEATHADMIAEMSGFATADDLVQMMVGLEAQTKELRARGDKRSVRRAQIDEMTSEAMLDRNGDILNDGSIEDEARALIHNDRQGEVLATEIRALARRANKQPTPYALAKEWAAGRIAGSKVSEAVSGSALQRYERAARGAAKRAEAAMLAGDVNTAFREKQAQMLNNALIVEAKKAKDRVDVAVRRLGRLAKRATIKGIDQTHLDQVHGLLEQVEFKTRSQRSIDRQESFETWAEVQQAAGFDVVTPPSFAASLGSTNWTRLTVEQIIGLDDTVKQIVHLGRWKQSLLDNRERRDFDAVVGEAVSAAASLPPRAPSDLMEPSRWDSIKSRVASMDAALLKMETVFDWLDGGSSNGVFNRIVFRRIAEAQHREREMIGDYVGQLTDHLRAIPKAQISRWFERVSAPELLNRETGRPWIFTRDQLVSMALNMGNQSSAKKLAGGYGWNEDSVMAVLNRELSPADWQYVQNVWDTIETLWPQIAALEKRLNGVEPEKVVARPLETSTGALKGGYFPVVYDPRRSLEADAQAQKSSDSLFENIYTRATTPKGFTQARTKVERPIHLSLGVITRHVSEVIHDLTHREAVMQADRFLSDRRVMKAVDDTLGPEIRKQFRPWLQHIANEWAADRAGNSGFEAFLKKMRTNATVVGLGLRVSTMQMQLAGYSNSAEVVGAGRLSAAIARVASNPIAAWEFVASRSGEVRHRMDTLDRDINDAARRVIGKANPLTEAQRFYFHGIGYMDRAVVVPTWIAAYNKGIEEGMSEEAAGYYGDKVVRQSQGAGAAKDLASVQRGTGKAGEMLKFLTMYYSYMSAVYQRQRTFARDVMGEDVRRSRDVPALMSRALWLIIIPPLLSDVLSNLAAVLSGEWPKEDDDLGTWALSRILMQVMGPIPILRDVATSAFQGFDYKMSPASRGVETALNSLGDAQSLVSGDDTKRATKNALETAGYATGLVPGQVATAAQFLVDVSYGEQDPEGFGDWYEGLTKGKVDAD